MKPTLPSNLYHQCYRIGFNLFPCYWGTGAKLTHLATGFREMVVRLPLTWRTRNYFGTLFGGSLYACIDPMYMLMLHKNLGPDYVVWDKSALIRFRKPGREAVYAHFYLTEDRLIKIRAAVAAEGSIDEKFDIELKDSRGTIICHIEKVVYVAEKAHYKKRQALHAAKSGKKQSA